MARRSWLGCAAAVVGAAGWAMAQQPPPESPPNPQPPAVPPTGVQPPTPPPATGAAAPPAREVRFSVGMRGELDFNADFDKGTGDLTVTRFGLGIGSSIPADARGQLQLGIDYEFSHYSFGSTTVLAGTSTPWEDIHREEFTATYSRQQSQQLAWFIGGSIGASGEDGASFSDSLFESGFGGVRYAFSESFVVGLGVAVRTQIEDSLLFVPLPMVNWKIADQWTLSSGSRPGLKLSYTPWENWTFALSGEYQFRDFRLDEHGPIPNGVGRETRFPVELSVGYAAGKQITLEAGLGYSFAQNLEVLNSSGNKIADQDLKGSLMFRFELGYRF